MDLSRTLFEVIDMRSFSNLWFWIALAVLWSSASHWVMGVPWDMVTRLRKRRAVAQKEGSPAPEETTTPLMTDIEDLAYIHARRLLYIWRVSGSWGVAITSAMLALTAIWGFHYGMQFAQAVFLIALPLVVLGILSLRSALHMEAVGAKGETLLRRLRWHRFTVQLIGMVSIFITALWGMFQNLNTSVLGG